jgi:hypothetical protein
VPAAVASAVAISAIAYLTTMANYTAVLYGVHRADRLLRRRWRIPT